jgi:hypothetical protein
LGNEIGESLNCDETFDIGSIESKVAIFEIGEVDSLRDQRFLAELLLINLWLHDRNSVREAPETLRRLVVVEEAHRYLSEERPPDEKGERTLLELAIAEARRYGWGFVVIDQMPTLLSRYVWDNMGTVIAHRLSTMESCLMVTSAIGDFPTEVETDPRLPGFLLRMPEDLALYRKYISDPSVELPVGMVKVELTKAPL